MYTTAPKSFPVDAYITILDTQTRLDITTNWQTDWEASDQDSKLESNTLLQT